ncbi:glycosyltransferase [Aquabacterium sp. J223]|uniref:glycosyltransferase n=1 Tax=Aquabacterium sp. J223 TaxID=2898431 RepID=UPI0021ADFFFF|nr:glycosyltransferase [Aquabacterium sp. J223]UUX94281.1 glycosyltransferase [Aquabacterium sp. J223]
MASSARSGYAIKCRLVEASLAAMKAMRQVDPRVRFLQIEPVVHVAPPADRPDLQPLADEVAGYQWQVWDMLAGRSEPQLGGGPQWLDVLGINYYHSGQWEVMTERRLYWHLKDPRRKPLGDLLTAAWQRYDRPLLIAETSHVGVGRAEWLEEVAAEVERVRRQGLPLAGICLYPVVDRPDWDNLDHWHRSGLWDAAATEHGKPPGPPGRVLCRPYARALQQWQRRLPHDLTPDSTDPGKPAMSTSLIVFSHLRWDFVFQRPQHLLTRLGRQHPVYFFEEPVHCEGDAWLEQLPVCDGITVLRPHTPLAGGGFDDAQMPVLRRLLDQWLVDEGPAEHLAWFYTPMALPLLDALDPQAVIYDCMDELAAFKHAPKALRQREAALLKRADIVLTGGPSLYEAKRDLGRNVHCLPSSVDVAHYAPEHVTRDCEHYLAAEKLQSHLLAPRLGFFGVIDERLDLALLAQVVDARPQWQFVMVGPVVKIDPEQLPQRPNLHWLGQQSYQRLPALVAGWDVCLLPFALNEHTRYISPTKTLEYLAAEKPVVSTPVKDVVTLYGEAVRIAGTAEDFAAACDAALAETPEQRQARLRQGAACVARHSWDAASRKVMSLIDEVLAQRAALLSELDVPDDEVMAVDTLPGALAPVADPLAAARLQAVLIAPAAAR